MLSENAYGSPARARLPGQTGCPGSAWRVDPVIAPLRDPPAGAISRELNRTRLFASVDSTSRQTRPEPQVAMTSPDRALHESASPVASSGTESDGEVRTCP